MLRRSLMIAMLTLAVAGCSTNIPADYRLPASPTVGLAVGSITYTGALGERQVFLRSTTTGEVRRLAVGTASTLNPFSRPDVDPDVGKIGGTFAIELPAGDYTIDGWRIVQGQMSLSPSTPFAIPFTVAAGESVYLGNVHFEQTYARFLGTGAVDVSLSSQAARDLPALRKRFTVLASLPITAAIDDGVNLLRLGGAGARRMDFYIPIFVPVRR